METSFHYDLGQKHLNFKLRERLSAAPGIELKGKGLFNTVRGFQWRWAAAARACGGGGLWGCSSPCSPAFGGGAARLHTCTAACWRPAHAQQRAWRAAIGVHARAHARAPPYPLDACRSPATSRTLARCAAW